MGKLGILKRKKGVEEYIHISPDCNLHESLKRHEEIFRDFQIDLEKERDRKMMKFKETNRTVDNVHIRWFCMDRRSRCSHDFVNISRFSNRLNDRFLIFRREKNSSVDSFFFLFILEI